LTGVITSVSNINVGTSNVQVDSSGGNVSVNIGGTANIALFTSAGANVTGNITATGNIWGGGVRSTSSASPPSGPAVGDIWYNTITDVMYRWTYDGTSYYWVDEYGSTVGVNGNIAAIQNGTTNVTALSSGGNVNVVIGGSNVATFYSTGATINGDLTVTGNATLSGNILGDRIVNGTTELDIQVAGGHANLTIGGTSNVVVWSTAGEYVTGIISATGNVTSSADMTAQNFNTLSDMALKTNINPLADAASVINKLFGVEYDWKDGNGHSYGLLAQQVEKVLPEQ